MNMYNSSKKVMNSNKLRERERESSSSSSSSSRRVGTSFTHHLILSSYYHGFSPNNTVDEKMVVQTINIPFKILDELIND